MNRVAPLLGAGLLALGVGLWGRVGAAPHADSPRLTVDLELRPDSGPLRTPRVDAVLTIKNLGERAVTVQHPGNRMALSFR